MRAFGSLPVAGAHQDFAVVLALRAMKLVNRHARSLAGWPQSSSGLRHTLLRTKLSDTGIIYTQHGEP